jgi:hypothetical protein
MVCLLPSLRFLLFFILLGKVVGVRKGEILGEDTSIIIDYSNYPSSAKIDSINPLG